MEKVGEVGLQECHRRIHAPFLMQNECDSSSCDHQSILITDHFIGTAIIVGNTTFVFAF